MWTISFPTVDQGMTGVGAGLVPAPIARNFHALERTTKQETSVYSAPGFSEAAGKYIEVAMDEEEYKRCCEILEVSPDATMGEIKRSYRYLRELYSVESIASMALEDEFSASDKKAILEAVETAFQTLVGLAKKERGLSGRDGGGERDDEAAAEIIAATDAFDGQTLKRIRQKMGVALDDIAMATRIQLPYLRGLEDEDFDALPAEVYTRGFVSGYAEFLSLDVQKVVADYMARYRRWKTDNHQGGTIANLFSMFKGRK